MSGLREPSFFERYNLCRVRNGYYLNFNITVKYSESQLTPTILSNALKSLIRKHPILSCNYFQTNDHNGDEDDYKNYVLRGIDLNYDDLVDQNESGDISGDYFERLNLIFFQINVNKPLWKLILNGSYLTIVCSHIFFDGNSGCFFHEDLANEINNLDSDITFLQVISLANDITSVPPAVGTVSQLYSLPVWFTVKTLASHFFPLLTKLINSVTTTITTTTTTTANNNTTNTAKLPLFKTNNPIAVNEHTNITTLSFNKEQTQSILKHVKARGLTFTPWLIAHVFASFSKLHPNVALNVSIPLNGRRYYPALDRYQVCVAASEIALDPPFENTDNNNNNSNKNNNSSSHEADESFKTAHLISLRLQNDLETRVPFYQVAMLKMVSVSNWLKSKIGKHERVFLEVSNVGMLKGKQGCWFSQDNGFSSQLQFNVVSGDDGMNITIGYLNGLKNDMGEFLQSMNAEFEKIIVS